MNCLRFGILISFSISVALFNIVLLFFTTTSESCLSISIALRCASTISCTFVAYCTSTCTDVDTCSSTSTTFSSLASFCTIYASKKCYSTTSSSSNFSMNIRSIDVALGPLCSFTCQCLLLLRKNSIIVVPVISMF